MNVRIPQILKKLPLFVFLLPVFFVLHGYATFYPLMSVPGSLSLLLLYTGSAIILFVIAWLFYRKRIKAALFVFILQAINFFFGPLHDLLKGSFAGKYSFLLPFIFVLILVSFFIIKKSKHDLAKVALYLNILMLVLCIVDIFSLSIKTSFKKPTSSFNEEFTKCADCPQPDIYFIIADEYAGHAQLKKLFSFDNTAFETQLRKRGFHIVEDSRSNYNYTMFSAPSILNMEYLKGIEGINRSAKDRRLTNEVMKNSPVVNFFKLHGYDIYNYSIFDLRDLPAQNQSSILPSPTRPLLSQTLTYRVQHDLWYHLVTNLKISSQKKALWYKDKKNNEKFLELTKKIAEKRTGKPKFVYTHLIMPHYPYYFDKDGNETPYEFLNDDYSIDQSRYLNYLQYSNKIYLDLLDHIKSSSPSPPIIILMSDHGFKSFKNNANDSTSFYNLNSVFLPDSAYSGFYKGMTNINQFRVLLNSQFKQQLPMLKDSVSFIIE